MKPTLCSGIENGIWHSKSPSCMWFLNPGVLNLLDRSDCLYQEAQDLWWLVDVDVLLSWIKLLLNYCDSLMLNLFWILWYFFVFLVVFHFSFVICQIYCILFCGLTHQLGLSNAKLNVHHKIKSLKSELPYLN